MKNLSKLLIVLLISILPSLLLHAQINPVYKIMKQRGWVSPIENNLGILTPDQYEKEAIISMGYDDTLVAKLKDIGVDLLELHKRQGLWNDKVFAALSDCIVIGTVTRIEHPFGVHSWFHTVAYVQVENYLRNDYNLPRMQIPIFIVSGPNGQGETASLIGEDTLSLGEHVLLELSACELIEFASDNHMTDLYKKLINDSKISFEIVAKYDLKDGKIIGKRRVRNLAKVKLKELYQL